MSKLLLDERPLIVLPKLAVEIGLNEAIFVQQIHFLLTISTTEINGTKWTYNTQYELLDVFPFWTESTLKRIIKSCKEKCIINVAQLSSDVRDKTNYYTIDYSVLDSIASNSSCHEVKMNSSVKQDVSGSSKCTAPSGQNELMEQFKMNSCLIGTKTSTKTSTNTLKNTKKDFDAQIQEKLKEYSNINLSAFYEWMSYKNYKNIAGVTKVLNMLNAYDFATQQHIVDTSIMNNYQGLFPPKRNNHNSNNTNIDFAIKNNVWDVIKMQSKPQEVEVLNA